MAKKINKVCVMNSYDVDPQMGVIPFSRGNQTLEQFNKYETRTHESGEIIKYEINLWIIPSFLMTKKIHLRNILCSQSLTF